MDFFLTWKFHEIKSVELNRIRNDKETKCKYLWLRNKHTGYRHKNTIMMRLNKKKKKKKETKCA